MRHFLLYIVLFYPLFIFPQELDTIYWEGSKKIYERKIKSNDKVYIIERYILFYNRSRDIICDVDYEHYNFEEDYSYSFLWDFLNNSSVVLWLFYENINEIGQFEKRVSFFVTHDNLSAIGSVQGIYYRGGKDVKYKPSEYYYDFPADPDSIFNAIRKELGLPDTLLHIKYKQPWKE